MVSRSVGEVLVTIAVLALLPSDTIGPPPARQLACDTAIAAGAVDCVVSESYVAGSRFPESRRIPWPPEGYVLRDRALLAQSVSGTFCVIPIRPLQRERHAVYGEPDDRLPRLHEGFDACDRDDVLTPSDPEYVAILRGLRQVPPAPQMAVQPDGNTIIGIHTTLDWAFRSQPFATTTDVTLQRGVTAVAVVAEVMSYVQWSDTGVTTGPYVSDHTDAPPTFVYRVSGDDGIHVIDVWTVRVTADGVRPFHDVVYLVHAPINVRVNELIIRRSPDE